MKDSRTVPIGKDYCPTPPEPDFFRCFDHEKQTLVDVHVDLIETALERNEFLVVLCWQPEHWSHFTDQIHATWKQRHSFTAYDATFLNQFNIRWSPSVEDYRSEFIRRSKHRFGPNVPFNGRIQ
jgi:hypothetical protein